MITYEEALARLRANADETYRIFHKKLLKNDAIELIGVRIPILRALAKEWKNERGIFDFPNDYYEIGFLKCTLAGALPFEEFTARVDLLVDSLDNWATCDCFTAKCIASHKEEFLPYIARYLKSPKEFTRRYGLVALLHDYVTEEYLPVLFRAIKSVEEGAPYYVMMAAAWLLAEIFVKFYGQGLAFLEENALSPAVRNKGIQKARESFRLTSEQKNVLKSRKIR